MLKKIRKSSERGQAIILIAAVMVGLVAIVGLMTDSGILLVEYSRLKRGIDSASIAAAAQFRKNFIADDLKLAGEEFLKFNQSASDVTIALCDPTHSLGTIGTVDDDPATLLPGARHDATLCAAAGQPQRKLVRVTATRYVAFGFMRVVGMNGTTIKATSVGEAASLDLVLVIDTSASMAYETTTLAEDGTQPADYKTKSNAANPAIPSAGDDPEVCNNVTWKTDNVLDPAYDAAARLVYVNKRCEPLGGVIDVALEFVENQFYPYDRVALIPSTGQEPDNAIRNPPAGPFTFMDNLSTIQAAIRTLKVFQPDHCPWPYSGANLAYNGTCLNFLNSIDQGSPGEYFRGVQCLHLLSGGDQNPTTCGSSNIGGALNRAGGQFAIARQDSFWVVIALIGGPANATDPPVGQLYPNGICPGTAGNSTWILNGPSTFLGARHAGFCRDLDPMPADFDEATYDPEDPAFDYDWSTYTLAVRHANTSSLYDADDYARDEADKLTAPYPAGSGAVLFTICMGDYCRGYPNSDDPASAENLGRYMAEKSGGVTANHGLYFFATDTSALAPVFEAIAKNIQTRLSQ